ncbi:hypothetical protein RB653_000737 [Dictyostelium firmibasis]|uniref:C2H2-type domain-containing protein n=1 Tax=Dictyostelium firmibasis TaxID=79012 RepID=A0AAN7UFR7_9MYCE
MNIDSTLLNNNSNDNDNNIIDIEIYPNINRLHRYNRNDPIYDEINNERSSTLLKQKCIYFENEKNNTNLGSQTSVAPIITTTTTTTSNVDININNLNSNNCNINQNNQDFNDNKKSKIKHICTCPIEFDNLVDYENHYHSIHKNFCTICKKKSYPNYKLLECHILETHDKLFETLCLKKKMFECFVCDRVFWSDYSRKLHLVDYHKYPKDFYFHSKQRSKELDAIRLKGLEILNNNKNNENRNNKNNNDDDNKMELDQIIMDIESCNTKDD